MKKLRLVDLLMLVADKKLKDGQMVLIDDSSYKFCEKYERFETPNGDGHRVIDTWDMNLVCYILEDYKGEKNSND